MASIESNHTLSDFRYQIDHRSSHTPTQSPDRTGETRLQRSHQGERLAAMVIWSRLRGGLAASYVAASLNWPIVIWYGEELTE
jgi:hypothetical protein